MNPLSVLRDSLYFFRRHLGNIVTLCLPLIVLESLLAQLLQSQLSERAAMAAATVVGLVLYPLYNAALILYLDTRSNGQEIANRDLLARAAQLWAPLVLLLVISFLLIIAGLALLVIPGIWIMINLVFAEYLLVLRGMPVMQAMRASAAMTTGNFLRILVCLLAVLAPLWLIDALLMTAFPEPAAGVELLLNSLNGFLSLFITVVLYRLFMLLESEAGA
ncbi:hypothetical protein IAE37_004392 [Pseudomonas sp. S31]|uniref:YciC family protein n=1 Tax=Pseudomonas sp. S31 TaxID=1564473 RepID=UPI0019128498|nr:YciC family protein [Pseudomonas sp. S31]MBK5002116.1 hypothetical protein [Pseudomonas sp. S31]